MFRLLAVLLPGEKSTYCIHWIGDCVGPRAGLDAERKEISLVPCANRSPVSLFSRTTVYFLIYSGSSIVWAFNSVSRSVIKHRSEWSVKMLVIWVLTLCILL